MAIIQKSIRSRRNGQRDEDEIQFCETRIQVLRRNPDRVKALAAILSTGGTETTRLQLWAIHQLDAMRSPEADAEMDRFAAEIGKLPEQSPARQRLSLPMGAIQEIQNHRRGRCQIVC